MDNWDEIRTAYQVARLGTVSGAADVLGVHHATVIRHVDALEARLGVKLFQRHARGYTPTEAGVDLLQVGQATDDQFNQLAGRLKGQGDKVSGELVVTTLDFLTPLMVPVLTAFRDDHKGLTIRFLTGERLFRLEYGEAHVAIRAGAAPEQPDNVVQKLGKARVGLYASRAYADRFGVPQSPEEFDGHLFVGHDSDDTRAPQQKWLHSHVPENSIVFRAVNTRVMSEAILAGAGIGFLSRWEAADRAGLVEILPPRPEWDAPLWLVTHVDLHRTTKVQTFLTFLKQRARDWPL